MKVIATICCLFFTLILFAQKTLYKEKLRPQFHFTPEKNWINDPNGLVYFDGEYHLFYQYNPFGNTWGHMAWGHAVTKDLIHWQHLPVALYEENGVMIFSGSAVIDKQNSSGFGKVGSPPMVAIYTGEDREINQVQYLAYSLDKGRTWTKYADPILSTYKKDFRDPKVFWYSPHEKWIMAVALAAKKQVQFYSSKNLINWGLMSSFGPAGDTSGVWECPDLFEVPIQGEPGKTKWVHMHSPAHYMQYFVGDFDGIKFQNENPSTKIYRPDYGPDYYAAVVYNNLPANSSPTSIAWVNNWKYGKLIPTYPWNGAMSLPRLLSVKRAGNEWILLQEPVSRLKDLRTNKQERKNFRIETDTEIFKGSGSCEIEVKFKPVSNGTSGVILANGLNNEAIIGFDATKREVFIDRSKSDSFSNSEYRSLNRFAAPLEAQDGLIQLRIFYDQSIVEVFVNDGESCLTFQVFPDQPFNYIKLFSSGGAMEISAITFWSMNPAWNPNAKNH